MDDTGNPGEPAGGADTYTHGHHESVLRSHTWRTAENSAGYLLAHLEPWLELLDVGCGPGTITLDLATRVAPGRVVGIDRAPEVVAEAEGRRAQAGVSNASFAVGDVYDLEFEDGRFDVVHAHQVLQHLTKPIAALHELRRVLRPGGLLAGRDSDYGGFIWAPADARLTRWNELYHEVTRRNRAEADAGRYLPGWVRAGGFVDLTVTTSVWTFAEPSDRGWWGDLWADRVTRSAFAEQALDYGLSNEIELSELADAWRSWALQPDGFLAIPHVEVLARRPPA